MQPFDSMVGDSMARPLAVSAPVGSPTLELVGTVGGMVPAEIPWQRPLETFLSTALDSPASVKAYRRQCTLAAFPRVRSRSGWHPT